MVDTKVYAAALFVANSPPMLRKHPKKDSPVNGTSASVYRLTSGRSATAPRKAVFRSRRRPFLNPALTQMFGAAERL